MSGVDCSIGVDEFGHARGALENRWGGGGFAITFSYCRNLEIFSSDHAPAVQFHSTAVFSLFPSPPVH
jgi:hypothetical protein